MDLQHGMGMDDCGMGGWTCTVRMAHGTGWRGEELMVWDSPGSVLGERVLDCVRTQDRVN